MPTWRDQISLSVLVTKCPGAASKLFRQSIRGKLPAGSNRGKEIMKKIACLLILLSSATFALGQNATSQTPATTVGSARRVNFDPQGSLEQNLLATIAANDPKFAYQKAIESLDKGEFPTALNRILAQLQSKDPEAFKKLTDKTLNRLGSD